MFAGAKSLVGMGNLLFVDFRLLFSQKRKLVISVLGFGFDPSQPFDPNRLTPLPTHRLATITLVRKVHANEMHARRQTEDR